jgi:hypothetical protein
VQLFPKPLQGRRRRELDVVAHQITGVGLIDARLTLLVGAVTWSDDGPAVSGVHRQGAGLYGRCEHLYPCQRAIIPLWEASPAG